MKRLIALLICCLNFALVAQTIDVTAFSQNRALVDTHKVALSTEQLLSSSYPSITETYQIPSFSLYDEYWDVENLRSRLLSIPFSEDKLMLILVAASNNPFEVPCSFDDIAVKYGPVKGGDFHPGVDLKVEPQTLVKSCFDGVVRMAKYYGDYGLTVVIRHYNGLETVYAHLDKLCVKPGQMVSAGDVIGQTGKTGNCKDYLLHFETRFMNEYFDPELIVDFENETLVKNTWVLNASDLSITDLDMTGRTVVQPTKPVVPTTRQIDPPEPGPTALTPPEKSGQSEDMHQVKDNLQQAFDGEEVYHVIQKGETLYRIASQYHTTPAEILKLNNLPDADRITAGKTIRVK